MSRRPFNSEEQKRKTYNLLNELAFSQNIEMANLKKGTWLDNSSLIGPV